MIIKATLTINTGLYMDIRPEIEITAPDGLSDVELAIWLHDRYHGLYTKHEQAVREEENALMRGEITTKQNKKSAKLEGKEKRKEDALAGVADFGDAPEPNQG